MSSIEDMYKKFDNLDELNLTNYLLLMQGQIKKWCDDKPNNKELKDMREAIIHISLLTNKMQLEKKNYHIVLSEYKSQYYDATERALKAEKENKAFREIM